MGWDAVKYAMHITLGKRKAKYNTMKIHSKKKSTAISKH